MCYYRGFDEEMSNSMGEEEDNGYVLEFLADYEENLPDYFSFAKPQNMPNCKF